MSTENLVIRPVILCGGVGTRLWPISRKTLPKQFIPLFDGKSLLEQSIERVASLSNQNDIICLANLEHKFLLDDLFKKLGISITGILEPSSRNTAAAITAAALNVPSDQLLLFMPSDHYLPDKELFTKTIKNCINDASQGFIITFGVVPNQPHTGYGYINVDNRDKEEDLFQIYPVKRFIEKPELKKAIELMGSENVFWNIGMILARADKLLESVSTFAPDIFSTVKESVDKQKKNGTYIELDKAYSKSVSLSLDYAVLEHEKRIKMCQYKGTWSDIGNWSSLAQNIKSDNNNNKKVGNGYFYNSSSTFIYADKRPVVALGLKDIVIVDTKDAVLVKEKNESESVKDVVELLKKNNIPEADTHRNIHRPWGGYDVIDEGYSYKVKNIFVNPGSSISLQYHKHRVEHWIVIRGIAEILCGEEVFQLCENESTFIPKETNHRLTNIGENILQILEVQSGEYLGEDDIFRLEDSFGRAMKSP